MLMLVVLHGVCLSYRPQLTGKCHSSTPDQDIAALYAAATAEPLI